VKRQMAADMPLNECSRLDRMIWGAIAIVACVVVASSTLSSFIIDWASFAKPVLVCFSLVLGGMFYRWIRSDEPPANALGGAAQVVAFATVAAPLSYIAASAAFPLRDMELAAWDSKLGFDWVAWLAFMNARPLVHAITAVAYGSFVIQTTAVVIALGIAGRALHLRIFVLAFISITLVIIAVSTIIPAQGVWGYWRLSLSDTPTILPTTRDLPLPIFFGLRDGTYRQLIAENAAGVISFPSLHAALGLLFIFALWPVNYIRWIALSLNLLMIAATPVEGSHYLSDVIAGLIVAAVSWLAVKRVLFPHRLAHPVAVQVSAGTAGSPGTTASIFRLFGKRLAHKKR
jgi:membrane-associated phospholipid phosphatase